MTGGRTGDALVTLFHMSSLISNDHSTVPKVQNMQKVGASGLQQ